MPALSLQPPLGDAARSEARAALALGRLDGALRHSAPAILRILAARVLRHTLVTALRQARYQFTDERFAAWFAGLVPLTEPGEQQPHGPRALVEV